MFDFFGAKGADTDRFEQATQFVQRCFDEEVIVCDRVDSGTVIATTSGTGELLGIANAGETMLVYIGAIWAPFPEPFDGSPLDDPNRTAKALLERFLQQGDAFLDGIVGNYAVCLVDGANDRLLLGRDTYGGPRVFFSESANRVSFSTRLIDFSGPLKEAPAIDRSLEDFLLGFEFLPDDRTLVAGVRSVGKGRLISWHGSDRTERQIQTFQVDSALLDLAASEREDDVVDALYESFIQSLKDQCPANGRIGVLQGGFDSMLITSVLKRMGREVETFTFRYQEPGYTQSNVDALQELLDVRHNWVNISRSERSGLAANRSFQQRGVRASTSRAGCRAMRCSTSTR